jgi:hypothetical protein
MMQLTPEQQDQIRKAKAAGDQRVTTGFTDEQKEQWEAAVQEELAGKEENLAHMRRIQAAAERPGFFGDLRRAIIASHLSVVELSAATGVDQRLLSDFRAGDAELPAAALERLVDTLGLRLMQEIPR